MANEKRLIDANELKKKTLVDRYSGEMFIYLEDLDDAPTVLKRFWQWRKSGSSRTQANSKRA